ncbi:microcystin-dependent protein [Winogradskyella wandonensis]|uniref:Microcystin-dependent protein n=1 Tax=Winogradskyella wandonensis TaxID=1442586 RepID=A0A4R1KRE7_9FLAO|nr:tail fiber protein [Winogradskyella wandonensis]TCK67594.1 microcystin-dependent protein [Winogradskyella wandonensis]
MKKTITFLLLAVLFSSINPLNAQEAYLGDIKLTAITFEQQGWMTCDGRLLPIAQYQALFALLGTTYGGDGQTTFALPDLRGRVPVGIGTGPGLPPVNLGETGGTNSNTLSVAQLPAHSHSVTAVAEDGTSSSPANNYPAQTKTLDPEYSTGGTAITMNTNMIGNTGNGQPVENRQPYLGLRYVICIQGIFPSQN